MRPPSIVRFDRLYLLAIAVGLLASILEWPATMNRLATTPQTAMLGTMAQAVAGVTIAIGIALSLLVWFFAARHGSTVARWIVVAFTVFATGSLLLAIANETIAPGINGFPRMLAVALQVVATVNLFRPDAAIWFAHPVVEEEA